jgi:hypothetical protein
VYVIWHSVYDAYWSPDVPQGVMVRYERAATWDDRGEADRACAQLNADSNRSTLDTMVDPWIVTEG